jgi:hypothetical protein
VALGTASIEEAVAGHVIEHREQLSLSMPGSFSA